MSIPIQDRIVRGPNVRPPPRLDRVPRPGQTYIIRDPNSRRQITLIGGKLRLEHHLGDQGGYHWECIETNGWLGFRNPSDHLHIGCEYSYNGMNGEFGRPVARLTSHGMDAYFNTRENKEGGQILLVRFGDRLVKMAIRKGDDHTLFWTDNDGAAWEFENVSAMTHRDKRELECEATRRDWMHS